jgi:hypothetical protein
VLLRIKLKDCCRPQLKTEDSKIVLRHSQDAAIDRLRCPKLPKNAPKTVELLAGRSRLSENPSDKDGDHIQDEHRRGEKHHVGNITSR